MTIRDIDEFTALLDGWDSDWRQLEAGRPNAHIRRVAGREAVLQSIELSHAVHQRGSPPPDLVTFGMPVGSPPAIWSGTEGVEGAVYDFNGSSGYDCVSGQGFSGVTLSFSRQRFEDIARRLGLDVVSLLVGAPRDLKAENALALRDFRGDIRELNSLLSAGAESEQGAAVLRLLDEQLPERLVAALGMCERETADHALADRRIGMHRAIEFMEEHCHRNPGMPEVCMAVGLSWRSLDRAFKECFDIGPKRYLLNLRLICARRNLSVAINGTRVADVANDWGFWHMGDFAREYRTLFGELPSESLPSPA